KKSNFITGILRTNPRGFGFVDRENQEPSIFIPKSFISDAVDGDLVEVKVNPIVSAKGPEGEVVKVLKRGKTSFMGFIQYKTKNHFVAYVPMLGQDWPVRVKTDQNLNIADRVKLKITDWENENGNTVSELEKVLGSINDASLDITAALEEYNIKQEFDPKTLEEASFFKSIPKDDLKNRVDLTNTTCITIDPQTAKDFDDALSLEKDNEGNFHLGVHIADVAHYVKPNTALDLEAAYRCNSVYFPGKAIPMLPDILSSNLCSLRPDEIRLCISVFMNFDKEGTLYNYKVARTFIKSKRRFTYEEAFALINSSEKEPLKELLGQMVELCLLLKKKRFDRGSIDFALNDTSIQVDENGNPIKIRIVEYDISHQLVEEFMLKANEVVASHLNNQKKMLIYRIHEEPSVDNFQDFYDLCRSLGFKLPSSPTNHDIQKLFLEAKTSPYSNLLSINFIRSMKLAHYSLDNIGHFGLALEHYCHFTSPIRRYTDLIIQRLLFDEEDKAVPLQKIAEKCSEKERSSFKAESSVVILKKLRLLDKSYKNDPTLKYNAVITRIKPFGFVFELSDFLLEGFIHVADLHEDFFIYEPELNRLRGTYNDKIYAFADKIQVEPLIINLMFLETKWRLVTTQKKKKKQKFSR
ncbi:MAG: VacB/RNase II family 3'-5' exoribonuclease, partial [Chlamydiae bacterium]|nr:VacB/RNase II family 3'-5' exoribonuclease [Chlamydiota bacterium]